MPSYFHIKQVLSTHSDKFSLRISFQLISAFQPIMWRPICSRLLLSLMNMARSCIRSCESYCFQRIPQILSPGILPATVAYQLRFIPSPIGEEDG